MFSIISFQFSIINGIQTDYNLTIRLGFILKKKKEDWVLWSVVDVWDHR